MRSFSVIIYIYKKRQAWFFDGACDYLSAIRQWKLILFGIQIHQDVFYDIFKDHWLAVYFVCSVGTRGSTVTRFPFTTLELDFLRGALIEKDTDSACPNDFLLNLGT